MSHVVDSDFEALPLTRALERLKAIASAFEDASAIPQNVNLHSHGAPSSEETMIGKGSPAVRRRLGDTEASYFLPSRESGVNDMHLMLGLNTAASLMARNRTKLVWAILRTRHPLLASTIEMDNYDDIYFKYNQPNTGAALSDADSTLEYRSQTSQDLFDSYLNGPRTLSNKRLSYLVVSSANKLSGDVEGEKHINLLICATHFLGDAIALHHLANEFLGLVGSSTDDAGLLDILEAEISARRAKPADEELNSQIPLSLEERLPQFPASRFQNAAAVVDHLASQRRQIGGHAFPRRKVDERKTIVPTVSFDADRTKSILRKCKENGVSISSAVFALCNVAWARTHTGGWELPMMMYSAISIRPQLEANERLNNSYFFLCIGFFNIVLPSFLPKETDASKIFWHRARSVKVQTPKIGKSPFLISRSKEMARERGIQARVWGMQDDGVEVTINPPKRTLYEETNKAPSTALIGLSMLGNLDGIYKHGTFPSIKLHSSTAVTRQRKGGMLLIGYTFVGKLWLNLSYDVNGFDDDVVQTFWRNLLTCVDEFL